MVQMSARERTARRKGAPPTPDEGNVVYVDETETAPMGHNQPPVRGSLDLTPEQWVEFMGLVFTEAAARKGELLPSFQRFLAGFPLKWGPSGEPPLGIEKWSDDTQGRAGDLRDKIRALVKQAENLHALEKAPILAASRAVDGYKNSFVAELGDWDTKGKLLTGSQKPLNVIHDRMNIYALWKEAEGRRIAREEAERAKAEAERLAAEAAKSLEPEDLQAAAEGFSQAAAAQEVAEAKPAALSRVHGQMGSVSSLRSTWRFVEEESDLMELAKAVVAGDVPVSYIAFNSTRLRVAVTTEKVRAIRGCVIREEKSV